MISLDEVFNKAIWSLVKIIQSNFKSKSQPKYLTCCIMQSSFLVWGSAQVNHFILQSGGVSGTNQAELNLMKISDWHGILNMQTTWTVKIFYIGLFNYCMAGLNMTLKWSIYQDDGLLSRRLPLLVLVLLLSSFSVASLLPNQLPFFP